MEDGKSRVTRKREERKSYGGIWKAQGVATLRTIADLGRVFRLLESLYDWLNL